MIGMHKENKDHQCVCIYIYIGPNVFNTSVAQYSVCLAENDVPTYFDMLAGAYESGFSSY